MHFFEPRFLFNHFFGNAHMHSDFFKLEKNQITSYIYIYIYIYIIFQTTLKQKKQKKQKNQKSKKIRNKKQK
jgi:prolipoprotein diacylglyceryltransferase